MSEYRTISCFRCGHSEIEKGYAQTYYEPGYPDEAHCQCDEVSEELVESYDYDEYELPKVCNNFIHRKVGKCGKCKKEINSLETEWDVWHEGYEVIPCCSTSCKKDLDKEMLI